MSERRLVITVGTSLFSSATWDPAADPVREIAGYIEWCEPGSEFLDHPRARAEEATPEGISPRLIREGVENALRADVNGSLALHVVRPDKGPPGRYSAEVTTLLEWCAWVTQGKSLKSLGDFLLAEYSGCDLLCGADPKDESAVAADHLASLLQVLGYPSSEVQRVLGGGSVADQLAGLASYLSAVPIGQDLDFIISGGYKVYGTVIGLALNKRPRWRVLYLHESSAGIVQFKADDIHLLGSGVSDRQIPFSILDR